MNPLRAFVGTLSTKEKTEYNAPKSLYNVTINSLQGYPINLSEFKGRKVLFVNVASKCGFTPQYRELQELQDKYQDQLLVVGVPCNQFGRQEPGNADDIQNFCERNYGVTFTITEKIDVKGINQHPLYTWLTKKELNGIQNSSVKWNFQKYLIDEKGEFLDYFYSITKPLNKRITSYLK